MQPARVALLAAVAATGSTGCPKGPAYVEPPPHDVNLKIGHEYPVASEPKDISTINETLETFIRNKYGNGKGPARRDAHTKAHGCVKAEFFVHDDVPESHRVGLFATPGPFEAWVRFSNSADKPQRDRKPDGRGMAIKVMNVPGEKILPAQRDALTQDFIMINFPVFVVRDVREYVEFTKDTVAGHPLRFFFHWRKMPWHKAELQDAERLALQKVRSPLSTRYWSMTPYALGEGAAKYTAIPCPENKNPPRECGKNYLREALESQLSHGDACFTFAVQQQVEPHLQPIEDPTVNWSETVSKFVPVATVRIPAQVFDTPEQNKYCEDLSFNPWHSLPVHRPLGGINRVRKVVYQNISDLRHELNGIAPFEPNSFKL